MAMEGRLESSLFRWKLKLGKEERAREASHWNSWGSERNTRAVGWREERWESAWAPLLAPSIFHDITVRLEASLNLSCVSSLTAAWGGTAG